MKKYALGLMFFIACFTMFSSCKPAPKETIKVTVTSLDERPVPVGGSSHATTTKFYIGASHNGKTEMFICEDDFMESKYNNSEIFYSLKEGQSYFFEVKGYGKSGWHDYRNIISVRAAN